MSEMPVRDKGIFTFSIIFCLNIIISSLCLAADNAADSRVSVSVLPNPINILAQKIKDTSSLLIERQQELREKKGIYANIFLLIFGACLLAVVWMIFSGARKRSLKREERRIKRKKKRISRKEKRKKKR